MPLLSFLSGRCGVARQAALSEDHRDRRGYRLRRQRSLRRHGTPYAAGGTSAGDSNSAWLSAPGKRKKRDARRGANTDTDTDNDANAEAAIVAAAAVTNRGGADGSDVTRSDGTGTGPIMEHATRESAKSPHGQEEEEGAYLWNRVRLWKGKSAVSGRRRKG